VSHGRATHRSTSAPTNTETSSARGANVRAAGRQNPDVHELALVIRNDLTAKKLVSLHPDAMNAYLSSFDRAFEDLYYRYSRGELSPDLRNPMSTLVATMNHITRLGDSTTQLGKTYCCYVTCPQGGTVCWQWNTLGSWAGTKCVAEAVAHLGPSSYLSSGSCDTSSCTRRN
jgi:hypothetical protein